MSTRIPASLWAQILAILGTLVLIVGAAGDPRWVDHYWALVIMTVAAALLRMRAVSITKFASLTAVQVVAMTGALAAGVTTTAIAMYAGVLLADVFNHRKPFTAAWINASREIVTLYAAYGAYAALTVRLPTGSPGEFVPETVPAIAVFFIVHFVLNRAVLYGSLLTRRKLMPEEQALILRYEVIVFFASAVAAVSMLVAIALLGKAGWIVIAILFVFVGMLLRRILEEAVAAEELNRIHSLDTVVSADGSLEESFKRIAAFANRLVNWRDFRILRLHDGQTHLVFNEREGLLSVPRRREPRVGAASSRGRGAAAGHHGERRVHDSASRSRAPTREASSWRRSGLASGHLGVLEIEHSKRSAYGVKQLVVVERFAAQLSTTIQIQELRRPLADALDQARKPARSTR